MNIYIRLYALIGSLVFLVMLVVSLPITLISLYKVLNPQYGIESWNYQYYISYDSWKNNYFVAEDKEGKSEEELRRLWQDFRNSVLLTSSRANMETATVSGIFTLLGGLLLPVHYKILNSKEESSNI